MSLELRKLIGLLGSHLLDHEVWGLRRYEGIRGCPGWPSTWNSHSVRHGILRRMVGFKPPRGLQGDEILLTVRIGNVAASAGSQETALVRPPPDFDP